MDKKSKQIYDAVFKNVHLTSSKKAAEHLGLTSTEISRAARKHSIISETIRRNKIKQGGAYARAFSLMPVTSGSFTGQSC
ncbi:hypothetical protein [Alteromonas phage PB15]|nr:hypothetical protein [Alteromonas phage PB15]